MEARGRRHENRGGAPAHLSRRVSQGARPADDARVVDGKALRQRDRRQGGRRLRADPRRLRVREGLSGREVFPRREAHDDRRRDERDPTARHRPSAPDTVSAAFAERVLAGDPRAFARAISLIEDEEPESADLVRAIFSHTGRASLIGVTGPPGAGKSTLVDRLVTELRQRRPVLDSRQGSASGSSERERASEASGGGTRRASENAPSLSGVGARPHALNIGVIAVDPTSPFSGGAVLGDRLRMQAHAADEGVFIRSMATRGHLGGLARATGDAALVLDAAGKDVIIIETVGVGQDEVEIIRTADVSIVTLVPGTGDEVQA